MGVEANAAYPGDVAYRLLTRLLLVGKKLHVYPMPCRQCQLAPTLLLFCETDCPNCEAVLRDLCGFYPTLKDKNIRVISIASDDNEETFVSRAASLPWAIKWYEPQGFYSSDFGILWRGIYTYTCSRGSEWVCGGFLPGHWKKQLSLEVSFSLNTE